MSKTIITIRPADQGRPMDLDEVTEAEGQDGRTYELSRGIVTVVEIPSSRLLPGLAFSIESVFKSAALA
jgi:hypothetical protein